MVKFVKAFIAEVKLVALGVGNIFKIDHLSATHSTCPSINSSRNTLWPHRLRRTGQPIHSLFNA